MSPTRFLRLLRLPALTLSVLLFAACGGQGASDSGTQGKTDTRTSATTSSASSAEGDAFEKAAALNRAELASAAADQKSAATGRKTGTALSASGADKFAADTRVPVYRFYVPTKGVHFYTASESEKTAVQNTLAATHQYEGIAFYVSRSAATGLHPVYRYFNSASGTHFYTISADEKAYVDANLPTLHYEGIAFYASQTAGSGLLALTRFFQTQAGSHFYTRNDAEAQNVRDSLAALYREEGVGFYVIDPAYVEPPAPTTARLPHSGVTDQQCYEAGSDTLVPCSDADATALNSEQDGHRTDINPMSYSEVPNPAGGTFARTECVKDEVTGLIWEGKEASGLRAGSNTYTNYDDPTQPQRWDGSAYVNPTQGEIDAATNSVGYVNHVNGIALCGYTDWRLPTADELQGIVDYGVAYPGPTINTTWFPNTPGYGYWSSSPYVGYANGAWFVGFGDGDVYGGNRGDTYAVRLVRASQ